MNLWIPYIIYVQVDGAIELRKRDLLDVEFSII